MLTNTATKLNDSHMDQVLEVYETQTSNIRVKLTKNLDIYFRKAFETAILNKLGHSLWGHFDDDNMLTMFATKTNWTNMPFFTVGNVFAHKEHGHVLTHDGLDVIGGFLRDIFHDGIQEERFTAFMARDYRNVIATNKGIRKLPTTTRSDLYSQSLLEIVPPYSRAKYEYGSNILGILEGRNPHPVIIRSLTVKSSENTIVNTHLDAEFIIN